MLEWLSVFYQSFFYNRRPAYAVVLVSLAIRDLFFSNLRRDGRTGEWHISYSDNGFQTRKTMLDCLDDLHQFLLKHNVVRPVILMMDGHLGHYGLEIAEYCDQKEIQIWLFSAHMTHHLQPLDLVMFAPVKKEMQHLSQAWMAENPGETLNKYTMITNAAYPAMEKVCTPELIRKSWEVSGVLPWNEERPRKNGKFGPSEIFEEAPPAPEQTSALEQPPAPEQPPQEMPSLVIHQAEDGDQDVGHEHNEADEKDEDPTVSAFVLAHERQLSLQKFIIDEIRGVHGVDITKVDQAMTRVRVEAELARNGLNMQEEVEIRLPFLTVNQGKYVGFTMKLTRDKFAEIHREQQIQGAEVGQNQSRGEAGKGTERRDRSDTGGITEAITRYYGLRELRHRYRDVFFLC